MFQFLQGSKTYLVAAAVIAYEVLGYVLGHNASFDVSRVLEALGLATLRAGIGKVGK